MKGRLPPGFDAKRFQAAVRRLRDIVGESWVFTEEQDIGTYLDAYSPFWGDDASKYVPSGAVAPADVAQVQKIVALANEYKLPLWPLSTGRNLGYGGAAPRLSGTLMLDLKRMNRILEVDEHRAYALVEPGVSYYDFYAYLREHQLKVWMDCAEPGWGSLIGNAMDRGLGPNAFRDHMGSICGLEVVLPNGDLMRTGAGAIPNSRTWNTFTYGYGPHVAPIFGQANFGIVTKAGFYLLPEPEASRSDSIAVPRHDDIHPFLDIMASLMADFTINAQWSVGSPLMFSRDPEVRAAVAASGGEPSAELERLGREKGLGYWGTTIRLNGAPEVIDAQAKSIERRMSSISGATFRNRNYYRFPQDYETIRSQGGEFAHTPYGIPSLSIFTNIDPWPSRGHIFFSPVVPLSGAEFLRARKVFQKAQQEAGLGQFPPGAAVVDFRSVIVFLYTFNFTDDAGHNARIRAGVKQLIKVAADNGWGEYRAAPFAMDDVMAAQSFNNHALLRYCETIKDALDPNGILAPGRSGIWPRHLRGRKT